jgi:hypothetical protein
MKDGVIAGWHGALFLFGTFAKVDIEFCWWVSTPVLSLLDCRVSYSAQHILILLT